MDSFVFIGLGSVGFGHFLETAHQAVSKVDGLKLTETSGTAVRWSVLSKYLTDFIKNETSVYSEETLRNVIGLSSHHHQVSGLEPSYHLAISVHCLLFCVFVALCHD